LAVKIFVSSLMVTFTFSISDQILDGVNPEEDKKENKQPKSREEVIDETVAQCKLCILIYSKHLISNGKLIFKHDYFQTYKLSTVTV
jgi:hypothetical protein